MASTPPPPPPVFPQPQWGYPQPRPSHTGRNVALGCLGLVVLLIVLGAIGAKYSTVGRGGPANSGGSTRGAGAPGGAADCSPAPCANHDGYVVNVDSLNTDAPAGTFAKPEAGNNFITMNVSFHNATNSYQSVNLAEFKLTDSAGIKHYPVVLTDAPGCGGWVPVQIPAGGSYGPKPLCFQGSVNGSLTLDWSPGFAGEITIALQ